MDFRLAQIKVGIVTLSNSPDQVKDAGLCLRRNAQASAEVPVRGPLQMLGPTAINEAKEGRVSL